MTDSSSTPSGNTTSTTSSAPWSDQAPYLAKGFQQADSLYSNYTPQYYTGNTVAQLNDQQTGALNQTYNYGMGGGSTAYQGANNNAAATLNGNFLSAGNPYYSGMVSQLGQAIQPQVDSQFESAGRYGSGAAANAFASALTNQAGSLAYQNYGQERSNQIADTNAASALNQTGLQNLGAAQQAGDAFQTQDQANISGDVARFNYNQQLPYQQLQNYDQAITGNYGSSGSSTSPYFTNNGAAIAGAALGAGSLGLSAYKSGVFNNLFGSGGSQAGTGSFTNGLYNGSGSVAADGASDAANGIYTVFKQGGVVGGRKGFLQGGLS